ncbi:hypothetical protein Btru_047279, partial [Bulinus truncatus]
MCSLAGTEEESRWERAAADNGARVRLNVNGCYSTMAVIVFISTEICESFFVVSTDYALNVYLVINSRGFGDFRRPPIPQGKSTCRLSKIITFDSSSVGTSSRLVFRLSIMKLLVSDAVLFNHSLNSPSRPGHHTMCSLAGTEEESRWERAAADNGARVRLNVLRQSHLLVYTVYKLSSVNKEEIFSLAVRLATTPTSAETFQALPVDAWGRNYFTVSWLNQIFWTVLVSNTDENNVEVYHNETLTQNIIMCSNAPYTLDIPESTVVSVIGRNTIGVIVGSVTSQITTYTYQKCTKNPEDQFITEMLMPTGMFGTDFFTVNFIGDSYAGEILVMALDDDTQVTVRVTAAQPVRTITLSRHKKAELLYLDEHYYRIVSNKVIQVFYMRRSLCLAHLKLWASSLTILVPTELFYYAYIISNYKKNETNNYALIISELTYSPLIYINDSTLDLKNVIAVTDYPDWLVVHVLLPRGVHSVLSKVKAAFGCYSYVMEKFVTSIHAAGFIASNLTTKDCNMTDQTDGDLIDNDCDGHIDEEIKDLKDNDGDSNVDEDNKDLTGIYQ